MQAVSCAKNKCHFLVVALCTSNKAEAGDACEFRRARPLLAPLIRQVATLGQSSNRACTHTACKQHMPSKIAIPNHYCSGSQSCFFQVNHTESTFACLALCKFW
uniref:Uncharacterized protein n=1 Tax=Trypanosoma vivax (strain Y486) TaxID=1055687 RepID=G0U2V6_TRYVY|nr:hypothetical protein, unlikely [Trypanosoma vivax Y486]